jgi:hypothetical protein
MRDTAVPAYAQSGAQSWSAGLVPAATSRRVLARAPAWQRAANALRYFPVTFPPSTFCCPLRPIANPSM